MQDTVDVCRCCGLVQRVSAPRAGTRVCCVRCGTTLRKASTWKASNRTTAAIALSALILYPLAVSLPMLNVEQFGHRNESSILQGVVTLLSGGHLFVGIVVLLCSIVLPLGKLFSLLVLSGGGWFMGHEHKATTYHFVEWTGRWGMLDVLLVAVLVAVLKLGDWVEVTAGPAAFAFTACVVLSLLATASFDPRRLWRVRSTSDLL